MEHIERTRLENRLSNEAALETLTTAEHLVWRECRYVERYKCHVGKKFVLWTIGKQGAEILDTGELIDIDAHAKSGLAAQMEFASGASVWLDHKPQQLQDLRVFGHFPYVPEITFLPSEHYPAKALRFPLVFKQQENSDTRALDKHYMTDVSKLIRLFPQFSNRKF